MTVLRPGIRTFKPRRSRMSARDLDALRDLTRFLLPVGLAPFDPTWAQGMPVVVEIGFGNGSATAQMAAGDPTTAVIAVDVHTPGVARLLAEIDRLGLANVRVVEGDALVVLEAMIGPGSLAGVRSYFPDPWPKSRHHKRRLVQAQVLELVGSRLQPNATWHLATDWPEYAERIQETFGEDDRWSGGVVERPISRPVTHYERRAIREGRSIVDLVYTWRAGGHSPRTTVRSRPATLAS